MIKILNKWFRKIHHWIAVLTALLIPIGVIFKLVGSQGTIDAWEKIDKIPSTLILFMAIPGSYLYFLPYVVTANRKKKNAQIKKEIHDER
jgi:hypothetical protein